MRDKDSKAILDASDARQRANIFNKLDWYNATEKSYAKGLRENDNRLFGAKVGTLSPYGKINVHVGRHAAKVLRLRSSAGTQSRKSLLKQEL